MNKLSNISFKIFLSIIFFLMFSSDAYAISFSSNHGDVCYDNNLNYKSCGSVRDKVKKTSNGNYAYCANRSKHFAGNSATYVKDNSYASANTCVYYLPKLDENGKRVKVDGKIKYQKYTDGDCSSIVGYIIKEGSNAASSDKEKWFWSQASLWIYLGKFAPAPYNDGNRAKYGNTSVTGVWNNNSKLNKIIRSAWKKYADDKVATVENAKSDQVNFSVSVSDSQFHYVPNNSNCGNGSYITKSIVIQNNENRAIQIEIPVTFDGVSLCIEGTNSCYSKGNEEILLRTLSPGTSFSVRLSTSYVLDSAVNLSITASFTENSNITEKVTVYDSVRYEKNGYQGMIILKTKDVNRSGTAIIEHEKETSLQFTQTAINHITCPSSSSNAATNTYASNSINNPVSKVCAGHPSVTSSSDYSVNFSGCNCMSIDLGNSRSVNVLLYEAVSFRYGHLTPDIIYAGGGFQFADGKKNGISTAYSGKIVWNYADYYGPVENKVPYYYDPNGGYNATAVQSIIEKKIGEMIKNNITLNFSTYDSNDQKNTARVTVPLSLKLENSVSYDANNKTFSYSSNNIQMNPAYLSQDGTVSYVMNNTKYPIFGGNKYYIPINFQTSDNYFPFDLVSTNLTVTGRNNFWIEALCHVQVDKNYYLYNKDGVRYRSIDVSNPFPKATKKSELPINWQEWYTNSSNALRIKNTFDLYPTHPLYKIILTDDKIKEIDKVSTLYMDWGVNDRTGINANGESVFVTRFFDVKSSGNRSYCKLGQFDASCDQ